MYFLNELWFCLGRLGPMIVSPCSPVFLLVFVVCRAGKYRRYDFSSLRDLLRVIRNKHSHYRELPPDLQARIGPVPEGFLTYFASRFPQLLCTCFYFALKWCGDDPRLERYFLPGVDSLLTTAAPPEVRDPETAEKAMKAAKARLLDQQLVQQQQQQQLSGLHARTGPGTPDAALRPRVTAEHVISTAATGSLQQYSAIVSSASPSSLSPLTVSPTTKASLAPGASGGAQQQRSGPAHSLSLPHDTVAPPVALVKDGQGATVALFPRRVGAPLCEFYAKSGHCRYGEACKFDHPPEYAVKLNSRGLPMRPEEPTCVYWQRNGECKFGPACKFDHPMAFGGAGGVWSER
jgi:serine/threonine-protein kinase/endoribonuclease IRE1